MYLISCMTYCNCFSRFNGYYGQGFGAAGVYRSYTCHLDVTACRNTSTRVLCNLFGVCHFLDTIEHIPLCDVVIRAQQVRKLLCRGGAESGNAFVPVTTLDVQPKLINGPEGSFVSTSNSTGDAKLFFLYILLKVLSIITLKALKAGSSANSRLTRGRGGSGKISIHSIRQGLQDTVHPHVSCYSNALWSKLTCWPSGIVKRER